MKVDTSRLKKGTSEVPVECQQLIDRLSTCTRNELIAELSKIDTWSFGKCELYHWITILDKFDFILEEATQNGDGNQYEWSLKCDTTFSPEDVKLLLLVLNFTTLLIEHSFSRHLYNSIEHLTKLFSSSNMNIVLGVLNLLYMFSKRSNFISRLTNNKKISLLARLNFFAESWGGKEYGFSLAACCKKRKLPDTASTLFYEFYTKNGTSKTIEYEDITQNFDTNANVDELARKIFVAHKQDICNLDDDQKMHILIRIRRAWAFRKYSERLTFVQARLQALSVLIYSNSVQENIHQLLYPGFLEELVELMGLSNSHLVEIKAAALRTLTSIIHLDRNPHFPKKPGSRLAMIIDVTGASSYHGFLPTLVRTCINSLTSFNSSIGGQFQQLKLNPNQYNSSHRNNNNNNNNNSSSSSGSSSGGDGSSSNSTRINANSDGTFYLKNYSMEHNFPLPLATALFSFLYHLASYESGGEALVSCGMMESLLRIINWNGYELEHVTFVTRAVRVIDLITNIEMNSFQNYGGLESFINRLDLEVNCCRQEQPFEIEPQQHYTNLINDINDFTGLFTNSNSSNDSTDHLASTQQPSATTTSFRNVLRPSGSERSFDGGNIQSHLSEISEEHMETTETRIPSDQMTIAARTTNATTPTTSSATRTQPDAVMETLTTVTDDIIIIDDSTSDEDSRPLSPMLRHVPDEIERQQQQIQWQQQRQTEAAGQRQQVQFQRAVYIPARLSAKTCLPQRAALLKSMLNFLKKAIQDQAFSDSIRHLMEGTLPSSLRHIISNAEYYGPSLFLLATDVVTVYVFQEPSLLSSLQDNGLTDVVLQALLKKDVPATREVLGSLPNVFSALCLNTRGLHAFVKYAPFERLYKVLLSPVYLIAMRRRRSNEPMGDTASNLGNAMDELMRHQPSLKAEATKAIIKLLNELVHLGTDPKYICWRPNNKNDAQSMSFTNIPLNTLNPTAGIVNSSGSSAAVNALLRRQQHQQHHQQQQHQQQNHRPSNTSRNNSSVASSLNVNVPNANEADMSDGDDDDDDEEEASTSSHHNQRDERPDSVSNQSSVTTNHSISNNLHGGQPMMINPVNSDDAMITDDNCSEQRELIPLIDYILNAMKFVDAILSNNSTDDHCREFVQHGGLQPLLSILALPNLPVDSPVTTSAQAVAAVCKSILNLSHESEVLSVALNQLNIIVDKLQPLQVHIENPGGSVLLRELANCPNIDAAFSNASYTPLLHAMSAVHGYIVMLVHICRTGQSEIRMILLEKWGKKKDLLKNLVQLYTALVWESTLLLALCTDDVFPSECEFGKEDIEKLPNENYNEQAAQESNATTTASTSRASACNSNQGFANILTNQARHADDDDDDCVIIEATSNSNQQRQQTAATSSTEPKSTSAASEQAGPKTTNVNNLNKKKLIASPGQLRYIKALLGASSRLGRGLAELFGNLVKLCVGSPLRQRRGQNYPPTPAYTSEEAKDIARVLSYILVDGFSYEKLSPSPIPKLKLTFLICSVGFTGPMLFDEKRYAFHLMLYQFVKEGGLRAFFQMFEWALCSTESSSDDQGSRQQQKKLKSHLKKINQKFPDGTGEFLDAWLMLLEKMVNPKAILESPHVINPTTQQMNTQTITTTSSSTGSTLSNNIQSSRSGGTRSGSGSTSSTSIMNGSNIAVPGSSNYLLTSANSHHHYRSQHQHHHQQQQQQSGSSDTNHHKKIKKSVHEIRKFGFDPILYLVTIHRLAFDAVIKIWGMKPLQIYGIRMTESMMSILKHIIKGEQYVKEKYNRRIADIREQNRIQKVQRNSDTLSSSQSNGTNNIGRGTSGLGGLTSASATSIISDSNFHSQTHLSHNLQNMSTMSTQTSATTGAVGSATSETHRRNLISRAEAGRTLDAVFNHIRAHPITEIHLDTRIAPPESLSAADLTINEEQLTQLMDMGFSEEHATTALLLTASVQDATEYLLSHPSTPPPFALQQPSIRQIAAMTRIQDAMSLNTTEEQSQPTVETNRQEQQTTSVENRRNSQTSVEPMDVSDQDSPKSIKRATESTDVNMQQAQTASTSLAATETKSFGKKKSGSKSQLNSRTARRKYQITTDPPLQESCIDDFCDTAIEKTIFLMDELPETVAKGTDLLVILYRRNNLEWRQYFLLKVIKELNAWIDFIRKQLRLDDKNIRVMLYGEGAQKFFVRLQLCSLLMDDIYPDMRESICYTINELHTLSKLLALLSEVEELLRIKTKELRAECRRKELLALSVIVIGDDDDDEDASTGTESPAGTNAVKADGAANVKQVQQEHQQRQQQQHTNLNKDIKMQKPKWIAQMITLIDLVEKVNLSVQRKKNMLNVTWRTWKWYDINLGRWNIYSTANNKIIDQAYENGEASVPITSGRQRYTINFNCMSQVNDESGNHRPVILSLRAVERYLHPQQHQQQQNLTTNTANLQTTIPSQQTTQPPTLKPLFISSEQNLDSASSSSNRLSEQTNPINTNQNSAAEPTTAAVPPSASTANKATSGLSLIVSSDDSESNDDDDENRTNDSSAGTSEVNFEEEDDDFSSISEGECDTSAQQRHQHHRHAKLIYDLANLKITPPSAEGITDDKSPALPDCQRIYDNTANTTANRNPFDMPIKSVKKIQIDSSPVGLFQYDTGEIVCCLVRLLQPEIDVDRDTFLAIMKLCVRLTKNFNNAKIFAQEGGVRLLLGMRQTFGYMGFPIFATLLIRHVLEEPKTLALAMEKVIAARTMPTIPPGYRDLLFLLRQMSSAVSRDPEIFREVAQRMLHIDFLNPRLAKLDDTRLLVKSVLPSQSSTVSSMTGTSTSAAGPSTSNNSMPSTSSKRTNCSSSSSSTPSLNELNHAMEPLSIEAVHDLLKSLVQPISTDSKGNKNSKTQIIEPMLPLSFNSIATAGTIAESRFLRDTNVRINRPPATVSSTQNSFISQMCVQNVINSQQQQLETNEPQSTLQSQPSTSEQPVQQQQTQQTQQELAAARTDELSTHNCNEQCRFWHMPPPTQADKPLLPRATILKFLADAVRSYQIFAPLIVEHQYTPADSSLIKAPQSVLSFILDKFLPLEEHPIDREISSMSRVLIAALASCSDQVNVQTIVVCEVKAAINRVLVQPESIDKHLHLQILAGLIPIMIENYPPENSSLLKLHHMQPHRNEIFYLMVRKGLISDLAKLTQFLDLSSPHTIGTVNATLKPLETLLRMTNAPGPISFFPKKPFNRRLFYSNDDHHHHHSVGGSSNLITEDLNDVHPGNRSMANNSNGIDSNHHHHHHHHQHIISNQNDMVNENAEELQVVAENLVRPPERGQPHLDDIMDQLLEHASNIEMDRGQMVVNSNHNTAVRRVITEFFDESSTESGETDSNGSDNDEREIDEDDDNEEEAEDRSEIDVDEETRQFIEIYDHVYNRHLSPAETGSQINRSNQRELGNEVMESNSSDATGDNDTINQNAGRHMDTQSSSRACVGDGVSSIEPRQSSGVTRMETDTIEDGNESTSSESVFYSRRSQISSQADVVADCSELNLNAAQPGAANVDDFDDILSLDSADIDSQQAAENPLRQRYNSRTRHPTEAVADSVVAEVVANVVAAMENSSEMVNVQPSNSSRIRNSNNGISGNLGRQAELEVAEANNRSLVSLQAGESTPPSQLLNNIRRRRRRPIQFSFAISSPLAPITDSLNLRRHRYTILNENVDHTPIILQQLLGPSNSVNSTGTSNGSSANASNAGRSISINAAVGHNDSSAAAGGQNSSNRGLLSQFNLNPFGSETVNEGVNNQNNTENDNITTETIESLMRRNPNNPLLTTSNIFRDATRVVLMDNALGIFPDEHFPDDRAIDFVDQTEYLFRQSVAATVASTPTALYWWLEESKNLGLESQSDVCLTVAHQLIPALEEQRDTELAKFLNKKKRKEDSKASTAVSSASGSIKSEARAENVAGTSTASTSFVTQATTNIIDTINAIPAGSHSTSSVMFDQQSQERGPSQLTQPNSAIQVNQFDSIPTANLSRFGIDGPNSVSVTNSELQQSSQQFSDGLRSRINSALNFDDDATNPEDTFRVPSPSIRPQGGSNIPISMTNSSNTVEDPSYRTPSSPRIDNSSISTSNNLRNRRSRAWMLNRVNRREHVLQFAICRPDGQESSSAMTPNTTAHPTSRTLDQIPREVEQMRLQEQQPETPLSHETAHIVPAVRYDNADDEEVEVDDDVEIVEDIPDEHDNDEEEEGEEEEEDDDDVDETDNEDEDEETEHQNNTNNQEIHIIHSSASETENSSEIELVNNEDNAVRLRSNRTPQSLQTRPSVGTNARASSQVNDGTPSNENRTTTVSNEGQQGSASNLLDDLDEILEIIDRSRESENSAVEEMQHPGGRAFVHTPSEINQNLAAERRSVERLSDPNADVISISDTSDENQKLEEDTNFITIEDGLEGEASAITAARMTTAATSISSGPTTLSARTIAAPAALRPAPTSLLAEEITIGGTVTATGTTSSSTNAHSNAVVTTSINQNRAEMSAEVREALGDLEVPEGVDPSFLAALPQEMREEVIAEHLRLQRLRQRAQQISIQVEHAAVAEVNPEFLAALPPNIQEEVLAQQRIEQQRQAAATANPNDPVDAAAFFQNLPQNLRQAILTDMEDSQISVLPPELAAEAQNLRRDWENRNRQIMHERLINQMGSNSPSTNNILNLYRSPRFPFMHNVRLSQNWQTSSSGDRINVHHHSGGNGGAGATNGSSSGIGIGGSGMSGSGISVNSQNGNINDPSTNSSPSLMTLMERQGKPLLDHEALASLLILLFIDDPKFNTLRLHRVIRNLCYHVPTREWIINALLSVILKTNESYYVGTLLKDKIPTKLNWLNIRSDAALGSRANVFTIEDTNLYNEFFDPRSGSINGKKHFTEWLVTSQECKAIDEQLLLFQTSHRSITNNNDDDDDGAADENHSKRPQYNYRLPHSHQAAHKIIDIDDTDDEDTDYEDSDKDDEMSHEASTKSTEDMLTDDNTKIETLLEHVKFEIDRYEIGIHPQAAQIVCKHAIELLITLAKNFPKNFLPYRKRDGAFGVQQPQQHQQSHLKNFPGTSQQNFQQPEQQQQTQQVPHKSSLKLMVINKKNISLANPTGNFNFSMHETYDSSTEVKTTTKLSTDATGSATMQELNNDNRYMKSNAYLALTSINIQTDFWDIILALDRKKPLKKPSNSAFVIHQYGSQSTASNVSQQRNQGNSAAQTTSFGMNKKQQFTALQRASASTTTATGGQITSNLTFDESAFGTLVSMLSYRIINKSSHLTDKLLRLLSFISVVLPDTHPSTPSQTQAQQESQSSSSLAQSQPIPEQEQQGQPAQSQQQRASTIQETEQQTIQPTTELEDEGVIYELNDSVTRQLQLTNEQVNKLNQSNCTLDVSVETFQTLHKYCLYHNNFNNDYMVRLKKECLQAYVMLHQHVRDTNSFTKQSGQQQRMPSLPAPFLNEEFYDTFLPKPERLALIIETLVDKSCSEEGLEDATSLLLNLSQCCRDTRAIIFRLLVDAANILGRRVEKQIRNLLDDLRMMNLTQLHQHNRTFSGQQGASNQNHTSITSSSCETSPDQDINNTNNQIAGISTSNGITAGSAGAGVNNVNVNGSAGPSGSSKQKGMLQDRFTREIVVITAPTRLKQATELQLASMIPLISKTSAQAIFLRFLKTIIQIRENVIDEHNTIVDNITKERQNIEAQLTAAEQQRQNNQQQSQTTSNVPQERVQTQSQTEPAPQPSTKRKTVFEMINPYAYEMLSLSELLYLDNLWDTLSNCLIELELSADYHAVLVLQSAVEAFFLVHATPQKKTASDAPTSAPVMMMLRMTRSNDDDIEHGIRIGAAAAAESSATEAAISSSSSSSSGSGLEQHQLEQNSQETEFESENEQQEQQTANTSHASVQSMETDDSDAHASAQNRLTLDQRKFLQFAEKHRTVLNQILRQSTGHLADGPFAVLVDHTRILDFDVKRRYFRTELERLDEGIRREEIAVHVNRKTVFEDSFRELYRRNAEEWKNRFYIVFEDEEGQDAGGLLREWYVIISREIFNPMYALFTVSPGDRVTYMINSSSHANPNHLCYYKFVGRVIAKAIYDNKLLECYFTRSFYKHILGIQVKYTDMESEDYEFYKSLIFLLEHEVSALGYDLTFSLEVQEFGVTEIKDLVTNGRNVFVTDDNKLEYIRLVCQLKMSNSIKQQLNAFLEGFYDIIPKRLISIFNEQELELLISGLPNVDIEDLRSNTEYHKYQTNSIQIQWFWRALRSFDQAERAKFLQFVTGTSKVPLNGFGSLEGMNGIQKFQIHCDDRSTDRLPSAHTCFNQLDLPVYKTYDKLRSSLLKAIHECSEGFGFA